MADRSNYIQPTYNNISQPRSSTFLDYRTGMERPNNSYAAHYRTAKQNLEQRDSSEWADGKNPFGGAGFNVGALAGAAEGGSAKQFSKIGKSEGGESTGGGSKKGMSSGLSTGLGIATGGVTQLSQMGAKDQYEKKNEIGASMLGRTTQLADLGYNVGGGWGALIGAVVGAGWGLGEGISNRGKRLLYDENKGRANAARDLRNRNRLIMARDQDQQQRLSQMAASNTAAKQYADQRAASMGSSLRYKNGGQLYHAPIIKLQLGGPVGESEQQQLLKAVYAGLQQGMEPEQISQELGLELEIVYQAIEVIQQALQQQQGTMGAAAPSPQPRMAPAPTFKRGGMAGGGKKKADCGCNAARIFREGGVVELAKENIIADGPSHDEMNNTGAANDKGLPVVYKGKKIAEIESKELVINHKTSEKIEELRRLVGQGNEKAKKELGELILAELHHNTYDYTDLMV